MQHAAKRKQNVKQKEERKKETYTKYTNKARAKRFFRIVLMALAYVRVQYLESRIRGVVVIVQR